MPLLPVDQHVVGGGFAGDGDAEQSSGRRRIGCGGDSSGRRTVQPRVRLGRPEARVGSQVLASQPVIDAERPGFQVGEDAMRPRQDDVRGHRPDAVRVVGHAGERRSTTQTSHRSWRWRLGAALVLTRACRLAAEKSAIGASRSRPGPPSCTSITATATSILPSALRSLPAFRRIGLGAERDRRLLSISTRPESGARSGATVARRSLPHSSQADLYGAEPQLLLQLQGGDAVGMGGHQIRRPKPDGERQLRSVHHRPGGYRRRPPQPAHSQVNALVASSQPLGWPQSGERKPSGPARISQIRSTRPPVRKAALKLDERARASWPWRTSWL